MIPILVTTLTASLLGSLHCAGMCGGLIAFYAGGSSPGSVGVAHVGYHGARLVAYGTLGFLAGFLGGAIDGGGGAFGIQRSAALIAGGTIALWGLAALWPRSRWSAFQGLLPLRLQQTVSRAMAGLTALPPARRATLLGLLSALLPCGWLYAFVLAAAGTGSPFTGAAVMVAFWAGTVPMLAGLGVGVHLMTAPLRRRLPGIAAILLLVLGLVTVGSRWNPTATTPAPQGGHATPSETIQTIRSLEPDAACCHDGE